MNVAIAGCRNTTREIAHLAQCRPYRQYLHNTGNSSSYSGSSSTQALCSLSTEASLPAPLSRAGIPQSLNNSTPVPDNRVLAPLTAEVKDALQLKAAFGVYMGARPFTLLADQYFQQYLSSHSGYINYVPASYSELAGRLLEKAYELVHRCNRFTPVLIVQ